MARTHSDSPTLFDLPVRPDFQMEAGLLREVAVEGTKTYFDTNTDDHHHFFIEGDNQVIDIPGSGVSMARLPEAPEGMEIVRVDVVVRLRRKG